MCRSLPGSGSLSLYRRPPFSSAKHCPFGSAMTSAGDNIWASVSISRSAFCEAKSTLVSGSLFSVTRNSAVFVNTRTRGSCSVSTRAVYSFRTRIMRSVLKLPRICPAFARCPMPASMSAVVCVWAVTRMPAPPALFSNGMNSSPTARRLPTLRNTGYCVVPNIGYSASQLARTSTALNKPEEYGAPDRMGPSACPHFALPGSNLWPLPSEYAISTSTN